MNEEKKSKGDHTQKSSRTTTQKSPGDKLKNERGARKAVRKKLRHCKKDNSLTVEEKKKLKAQTKRGRRMIRAEAAVSHRVRREIAEHNEDENAGVQSASFGMESVGLVTEKVKLDRYGKKMHRRTEKQSAKMETAKKETSRETAKSIQKNRMKREMVDSYQKKKAKETAVGLGKKFVDKAGDMVGRIGEFIAEHILQDPKVLIIVGIIALLLIVICCMFSSCSLMAGGVNNTTVVSSYTAEDDTILAVEADYTALEDALQEEVNSIETTYPGYDEYRYELAEIGHNPYQLAALLTVLYEDYTQGEVQSELQSIFDAQYELTTTEIVEVRTRTETRTRWERRTRTETRTGTRLVWDASLRRYVTEEYTYEVEVEYWVEVEYEVEVEYNYYILKTVLTNATMDSVVRGYGLSADAMERYEILLVTYGNKSYLFGDDIYSVADPGEYQDYDVPAEYLTDLEFGRMLQCAEQYLGYPYVWGGSSPSTSFDCSGFVSYVINNCGNGWSVGRKTANGLLGCCTRISAADAKPGDLIFFQGTYNTTGASHVGIYVGDGMMIHCGNPIQYASVNSTYWQEHFLTYGRIN